MTDQAFIHGSFGDLDEDEPYAGIRRRSFDSEGATVTRYDFEPGATFPIHRHPEEQIIVVVSGDLEFTVDDTKLELSAGDWSTVKGGVEHGITAGANGTGFLATLVPRRQGRNAYTVVA